MSRTSRTLRRASSSWPRSRSIRRMPRGRSSPPSFSACARVRRRPTRAPATSPISEGTTPVTHADTAGAAKEVAELGDPTRAAIASKLAGEIYGLQVLDDNVQDIPHNTTRFIVMAEEPIDPPHDEGPVITTFVFRVRSVPAALYKALGGFATNGVNITKLESYIIDGSFRVAQFYADIEGHPENRMVRLALEELSFFSREVKILGVYPANPFRGTVNGD